MVASCTHQPKVHQWNLVVAILREFAQQTGPLGQGRMYYLKSVPSISERRICEISNHTQRQLVVPIRQWHLRKFKPQDNKQEN